MSVLSRRFLPLDLAVNVIRYVVACAVDCLVAGFIVVWVVVVWCWVTDRVGGIVGCVRYVLWLCQ